MRRRKPEDQYQHLFLQVTRRDASASFHVTGDKRGPATRSHSGIDLRARTVSDDLAGVTSLKILISEDDDRPVSAHGGKESPSTAIGFVDLRSIEPYAYVGVPPSVFRALLGILALPNRLWVQMTVKDLLRRRGLVTSIYLQTDAPDLSF